MTGVQTCALPISAVAAIGQIQATVRQIQDHSTSIAGAVEEQHATTREISQSLAAAANGTSEISDGASHVARAAQQTAAGASRTQASAGELARFATNLRRLTERFDLGTGRAPAATLSPAPPAEDTPRLAA